MRVDKVVCTSISETSSANDGGIAAYMDHQLIPALQTVQPPAKGVWVHVVDKKDF